MVRVCQGHRMANLRPLFRETILTKKIISGISGAMKTITLLLHHERVDDIPLLLGFLRQLNFPELLERHLGSHHLHRGLSNGWLATVWLAFLLSQANHRKVSVQDWAQSHPHTLERVQSLPRTDYAGFALVPTATRPGASTSTLL